MTGSPLRILSPIAEALRAGRPVVALESSVLAQGLPIPSNVEAARLMTGGVARSGAVPAISAVVKGVPTFGLRPDELERFLAREGVRKVSARDLPAAIVAGEDGATTVAASIALAALAGISVFATGGIGGVHRDPPFDESADLMELARSPIVVVCSGAKSILDLPATLERLESLGVPVVGYRTSRLPGFFTIDAGLPLTARAESAAELAAIFRAHRSLGRSSALLVVQPPPAEHALPAELVDGAVKRAVERARAAGVRGAGSTPFLLGEVERETGGLSLGVNLALLESNAVLAGEIAAALATQPAARSG